VLRSDENYLRWQFGRLVKNGYAPNVTMLPAPNARDVALHPSEHPIASIQLKSGGPPLVVTDMRLRLTGRTLFEFKSVRHCDWIARDLTRMVQLDVDAARDLKRSHYDRLIFSMDDEREVVIEGLGQAYSPLLKFFWFKLGRKQQ
jgi:hypothetical protein